VARARNIKPAFFKNELLVEMSAFDRLLFVGLWCLADREGRVEDRSKRIKMELFPCDTYDVEQGLNDLQASGFIKRYEANGVRVISIINFHKHQTPHGTEKDSDLPDETGNLTVHERCKTGYVTGKRRKNNVIFAPGNVNPPLRNSGATVKTLGDNALNPDSLNPESLIPPNPPRGAKSSFEDFWECWPKGERKQDKAKCLAKWKREGLDAKAGAILADVAAKKTTAKWREGFVESPLVYLNGRRWEDGSGPAESASAKPGTDEYFEIHRNARWWADAGFESVWEAWNNRCNHKNADLFRDGKKLEVAA
jgi:hypothetical protein